MPIKYAAHKIIIISEEAWTKTRQNLEHVEIFGSTINIYISAEKHTKSDIDKTWNRMFMGNTNTIKHIRVWALKSYQVLIASKPIVHEGKRGAELLIENSIPLPPRPFQEPARESRPQGRSRKRSHIEDKAPEAEYNGSINIESLNENLMGTKDLHDLLVQRP